MCVALGGTVHCKASRLVFTCLLRQLIVCECVLGGFSSHKHMVLMCVVQSNTEFQYKIWSLMFVSRDYKYRTLHACA